MKNEKKLFSSLKHPTLTEREQGALRSALIAYRTSKPAITSTRQTPSPYHWFTITKPLAMMSSFLIILLVSGGVAQAAEGAVPGDLLYPVKTEVTEPVRVALAQGDEAKTEVAVWRAERRLEEAQTLAVRAKLTENKKLALEQTFNAHASQVEDHINTISEKDPVLASELATKFEASLTAHEAILTSLDTPAGASVVEQVHKRLERVSETRRLAIERIINTSDDSTTDEGMVVAVATFNAKMAPHAEMLRAQDTAVTATLDSNTPVLEAPRPTAKIEVDQKNAAERMMKLANVTLEKAQKLSHEQAEHFSSEQRKRVDEQLKNIMLEYTHGENAYHNSEYSTAFIAFQHVASKTKTLLVFLQTDTSTILSPTRVRVLEVQEKENTSTHSDENDHTNTLEETAPKLPDAVRDISL